MWSPSVQVVTEHPRGHRVSRWSLSIQVVTERPCKSLSIHMHHRVSRWSLSSHVHHGASTWSPRSTCVTAGWTGLTEDAHSGLSSGAWGLRGQMQLCVLTFCEHEGAGTGGVGGC